MNTTTQTTQETIDINEDEETRAPHFIRNQILGALTATLILLATIAGITALAAPVIKTQTQDAGDVIQACNYEHKETPSVKEIAASFLNQCSK